MPIAPMPGDSQSGASPTTSMYQVNTKPTAAGTVATVDTLHQFAIAMGITLVIGYIMVEIAGMSKGAGDAIITLFGIMLLVQLITRTSPFMLWFASHPLTPQRATATK